MPAFSPSTPASSRKVGGEIDEVDEVADRTARILNSLLPHDGQGQVVGILEFLPLDSREGHAVVGRYDHERVVQFARIFQHGEHLLQVLVEVLDLEGVIEQVGADCFIVRPELVDLVDFVQFLPAVPHSRSVLVAAVWFVATVPEAKRLSFRPIFQEKLEIGGVIAIGDSRGRRFGRLLLIGRAREASSFAVGVEGPARGPAFSRKSNVIVMLEERFGIGFELGGEQRPVVGCFFKLPGIATRKDAGTGGGHTWRSACSTG